MTARKTIGFGPCDKERECIIPSKNKEDTGYDLYMTPSKSYEIIGPGEVVMIPTNLRVDLPKGYFMLVKERGSTGTKTLSVRCGVIDEPYQGEVFVALNNTSSDWMAVGPDRLDDYMRSTISYKAFKRISTPWVQVLDGIKILPFKSWFRKVILKICEVYTEEYILKEKCRLYFTETEVDGENKCKAIAQGVVLPYSHFEVTNINKDRVTTRGDGKLGSSGK